MNCSALGSIFLQACAAAPYYFQVPISNDFQNDINALGGVASVIQPTVEKTANSLSKLQYFISVAVSNLYDAVAKNDVSDLATEVTGTLAVPTMKFVNMARKHMQAGAALQRNTPNIDIPLVQMLKDFIEDGNKCVSDIGVSIGSGLIMNTGSVTSASQKVRHEQYFQLIPIFIFLINTF